MARSAKTPGPGLIFLGLGDICGYYSQLEQGFIKSGIPCVLVNAYPSLDYSRATRPPLLGRIVESVAKIRVASARGTVLRFIVSVVQAFWMAALLVWSLFSCRAYIFSGGTSFFPPYDLWLLKLLRKRIIVVFHGSDARPPYINGASACETDADVKRCILDAAKTKKRLRIIEKYADVIVNHVLSSQFHARRIVGWLSIGIPVDASRFSPQPAVSREECVIVHAPTRPGPKGTARIEAAIENLRRMGHRIKFVKLVGVSNAEVLQTVSTCDFVVDELFSDTPMASFATEAALFGKPAIVGLYGYNELKQRTHSELLPPAVVCAADDIQSAIEKLITDRFFSEQMGQRARKFIEQQWDVVRVAERFLHLCNGTVPDAWYFDPGSVIYTHGWGVTEDQARNRVAAVLRIGGPAGLQLGDKPVVERAFIDFAAVKE